MNISRMTGLIDSGWNISNRRLLASKIGPEEMAKLVAEHDRICPPSNLREICLRPIPELSDADHTFRLGHSKLFTLMRKGNDILLRLGVDLSGVGHTDPYIIVKNKDITVDNIRKMLENFKKAAIAKFEGQAGKKTYSLKESATLKKIFSPEFKKAQGMNKDGYFVTTIINKKTNQPTEAFVKQVKQSDIKPNGLSFEEWGLYIKRADGEYEMVGRRSFGVDRKNKTLTPGWMDSYEGGTEYGGIGVRLHQIGVERALQEKFSRVEITALDEAFPFHYKCGYRSTGEKESIRLSQLNDFLSEVSQMTSIPEKELEECVVKTVGSGGKISLSAQTLENILKKTYEKTGRAQCNGSSPMVLEGSALEEWIQRIKEQPIFGN